MISGMRMIRSRLTIKVSEREPAAPDAASGNPAGRLARGSLDCMVGHLRRSPYQPSDLPQTGQGSYLISTMQSMQKGTPHDLHSYTPRSSSSLKRDAPLIIMLPRKPSGPRDFLHLRHRVSRGSGLRANALVVCVAETSPQLPHVPRDGRIGFPHFGQNCILAALSFTFCPTTKWSDVRRARSLPRRVRR